MERIESRNEDETMAYEMSYAMSLAVKKEGPELCEAVLISICLNAKDAVLTIEARRSGIRVSRHEESLEQVESEKVGDLGLVAEGMAALEKKRKRKRNRKGEGMDGVVERKRRATSTQGGRRYPRRRCRRLLRGRGGR